MSLLILEWTFFSARFVRFSSYAFIYDFLQYFEHAEEMEWAIEECKKTKLPVAANMCIGPDGDLHGVSAAECAIRMARAGADIGQ